MNPTYIIAEIGINHNGSLDIAKQLIDVAKIAGCNAVKFQKRNPDRCVPEDQKNKPKETPWGTMTYLEYKKRMEFGQAEFDEIDRYCNERDIAWSASVWDLDSLEFMQQYDVPWLKIPSAMVTNDELLRQATKCCLDNRGDIIISTGMSTHAEIHHAVNVMESVTCHYPNGGNNIVILHCNSSYPAPLEELNLSTIKHLANMYPYKIGYSGHEFRLGTTVASIYLGARVIERHITLDREMWGTDHLGSVEPHGLIKLVRGIRELEMSYGMPAVQVTPSEVPHREKLRG